MLFAAEGGCEGLSDRFVSGFWWIHTLGLVWYFNFPFSLFTLVYKAAEAGTSRVHRQDVAGYSFNNRVSHYMLAGVDLFVS